MRHDELTGNNEPERTTLVAVGELMLWPQSVGDHAVTSQEAGEWPAFVLLVAERRDLGDARARILFDLLEESRRSVRSVIVTGRWSWSVVDPVRALMRLRIQAYRPAVFDVDILVPAVRLLGLLPSVARGVPIGLSTHRHVRGLDGSVDVRKVLRHVVLVQCSPVPELAELADDLFRPTADGT